MILIPDAKEQSIIEIIQKMVKENEPEEKIVSTLTELGVREEQAKRLLLIAQADTFTLLQKEIRKMTDSAVVAAEEDMKKSSEAAVADIIAEKKKQLEQDLENQFSTYKSSLSEKQTSFQTSVGASLAKLAQLNDDVYAVSEQNKKMIESTKKDLERLKLTGLSTHRSFIRNALLIFGVINCIASFLFILTFFFNGFNIDYVTIPLILTLSGVTLIFLSVNL